MLMQAFFFLQLCCVAARGWVRSRLDVFAVSEQLGEDEIQGAHGRIATASVSTHAISRLRMVASCRRSHWPPSFQRCRTAGLLMN
jgi:hypothetical protein